MAEKSLKVDINCRDCGRKIERCVDNLCDNCNDKSIKLCTSGRSYHNVKKINILSGLLVDRKNKFLFVGEGNFSFTVAFNAYRQFLWDKYDDSLLIGVFNQQHFRNYAYPPGLMIAMLIQLHKYSITGKVIEDLKNHQACESVRKLAENALKCLDASVLELKFDVIPSDHTKTQEHLLTSIQEVNSANKYLLDSVKIQECSPPQELIKSLSESCSKVNKAIEKLSIKFPQQVPEAILAGFNEEKNNFDIISVATVDDMVHYMAAEDVTPYNIISSRYEKEQYKKTISEVKKAMLCNTDGYTCPSDEIVGIFRAVDCTNILQKCKIDARFIPQENARWSNLVWFQCPWTNERPILDLIISFLGSASDNCAPGTYVCVGITTHEDYMSRYVLEYILGENLDSFTMDEYEFLGVDDVLINKLLSYGYKHTGHSNIHEKIKGCHVTLVFRLKYISIFYNHWSTT